MSHLTTARSCHAYIAAAFEHPPRKADDKTLAQLPAEVAAGLTSGDTIGV